MCDPVTVEIPQNQNVWIGSELVADRGECEWTLFLPSSFAAIHNMWQIEWACSCGERDPYGQLRVLFLVCIRTYSTSLSFGFDIEPVFLSSKLLHRSDILRSVT